MEPARDSSSSLARPPPSGELLNALLRVSTEGVRTNMRLQSAGKTPIKDVQQERCNQTAEPNRTYSFDRLE